MKYIPLDEWLETPRARLLRGLRWFDWVDFDDLRIAIDAPHWADDRRGYDAFCSAMRRLVQYRQVERRKQGPHVQYRLVDRRYAKTPVNCEVSL